MRTRRITRIATTSSSRARSSGRTRRRFGATTSFTAIGAVMSCRRSTHGRRASLREAKPRLEAERAANPKPVPALTTGMVKEAKRRLEEELWTEQRANDAYAADRTGGVARAAGGWAAAQSSSTLQPSRPGRSTSLTRTPRALI
jgi:hypothetical protein